MVHGFNTTQHGWQNFTNGFRGTTGPNGFFANGWNPAFGGSTPFNTCANCPGFDSADCCGGTETTNGWNNAFNNFPGFNGWNGGSWNNGFPGFGAFNGFNGFNGFGGWNNAFNNFPGFHGWNGGNWNGASTTGNPNSVGTPVNGTSETGATAGTCCGTQNGCGPTMKVRSVA